MQEKEIKEIKEIKDIKQRKRDKKDKRDKRKKKKKKKKKKGKKKKKKKKTPMIRRAVWTEGYGMSIRSVKAVHNCLIPLPLSLLLMVKVHTRAHIPSLIHDMK